MVLIQTSLKACATQPVGHPYKREAVVAPCAAYGRDGGWSVRIHARIQARMDACVTTHHVLDEFGQWFHRLGESSTAYGFYYNIDVSVF